MAYTLKVNGNEVFKTDKHVVSVSVQSARGELAKVGTSLEDAQLNIVLEEVGDGGNLRLDHLEEAQRQSMKEIRTGGVAGVPAVEKKASLHGHQGAQMDTVIPATSGGDASLDTGTGVDSVPDPEKVDITENENENENNEFSLGQ